MSRSVGAMGVDEEGHRRDRTTGERTQRVAGRESGEPLAFDLVDLYIAESFPASDPPPPPGVIGGPSAKT